ncbi:hypothetical protein [Micromonospora purpureochromogenes]|uniref:Copper transporter n=1 Tax=Micromonospora purpureochromogenes TaxID=47872 RepID=A0ABX2RQ23_9ACTN|nr:hypothetical protein [Micromonospora purpureochromogenes]NYF57309.1 hypothetical protein [Micromonospora purpureochromogenes]
MVHLLMWIYDAQLAFTADQWSAFGSILGGLGSILAVVGAASLLAVEIHGRRLEARKYAQERRELAAEQREREARQRDADASLARLVIAESGSFTPQSRAGKAKVICILWFRTTAIHSSSMWLFAFLVAPLDA